MKGTSQQLSFRLAGEYAEVLEERAKKEGVSRHDYARELVIAAITTNFGEETRNRVAELQDELQKLREDLWTSVTALLVHAGKTDDEAATNWVRNSLMK